MDINKQSKFNLGDEVYIANYYDEFTPSKPYTVTAVLTITDGNGTVVKYRIRNATEEIVMFEHSCFGTCEECTKWCEKHNKTSFISSIDKTK